MKVGRGLKHKLRMDEQYKQQKEREKPELVPASLVFFLKSSRRELLLLISFICLYLYIRNVSSFPLSTHKWLL